MPLVQMTVDSSFPDVPPVGAAGRPTWSITESTAQVFEKGIKFLLCLLLSALLCAIALGVLQTYLDLRFVWQLGVHDGFRRLLVDALTILAVVEVFRTAMTYFAEGRVKVTYLIDTVLVSVLTEVLGFWFKEIEMSRMAALIALVLSLTLVRILAIHFSPNRAEVADGL